MICYYELYETKDEHLEIIIRKWYNYITGNICLMVINKTYLMAYNYMYF